MCDRQGDDHSGRRGRWTKQTILYEVGFRVALFCVLGALSYLIFFAAGAFGGSLDTSMALLSVGS